MRTNPMVMAHRGGHVYGRENALTTVLTALKAKPDIVELDVRKSRDGILYCHHGREPLGVFAASFFGLFTFKQIQKMVGERDTLASILTNIPPGVSVYLDIKDFWITRKDLNRIVDDRGAITVVPFGSLLWLRRLIRSKKVLLLKAPE